MKALPDGCVDAVITDPPYGANLGKHLGASDMRTRHVLRKGTGYCEYDDTPENFVKLIIPRVSMAVQKAVRALVFCMGSNISLLPKADALGGVYVPAACGRSRWGFTCFMPCALYGTAPMLHLGSKATAITSSDVAEPNGHPCPKPESWMSWAVSLASWQGETIIDPFLGSGTTAVAALKLGRHFLGFEISEEYCRIARERIALVEAQPNLFEKKAKVEQGELSI
jgi:16S rRNA G966 N2-methylase RsmD